MDSVITVLLLWLIINAYLKNVTVHLEIQAETLQIVFRCDSVLYFVVQKLEYHYIIGIIFVIVKKRPQAIKY